MNTKNNQVDHKTVPIHLHGRRACRGRLAEALVQNNCQHLREPQHTVALNGHGRLIDTHKKPKCQINELHSSYVIFNGVGSKRMYLCLA